MHARIRSMSVAGVPAAFVTLIAALLVAGSALAQTLPAPNREPSVVGAPPIALPFLTPQTTFGQVGFVAGQSMMVNVLNNGPLFPFSSAVTGAPPSPIVVAAITFLAGDGSVLKSMTVTVPPNHVGSATLDSSEVMLPNSTGRMGVHAQVKFILPPGPSAGIALTVSTLEVFDTATGRTSLVLQAPAQAD